MTIFQNNPRSKFFVLIVIALVASAVLGYGRFSKIEAKKQALNLDGLFVNIQGVDVKTVNSGFFSDKPYEKITIKIPSLASKGDDATKEGAEKVNQIIDREKLGEGFTKWLKTIFNSKTARQYTDDIEVWYRDDKIIDEKYK
ncbi:hypothetical protein SAMN02745116_02210 [Pilibacter termitis]|uniref:Uncharacterized protein n=1 Tax=Pilibacter termitis TaxID=263852 RepID=A0A1T4QJ57_9ENTE|nr:hypothetical protein [Pilibacter termitis]SKA03759.1 hypothetical protein SAMN02745116_02210 [Pilibacter termitis]